MDEATRPVLEVGMALGEVNALGAILAVLLSGPGSPYLGIARSQLPRNEPVSAWSSSTRYFKISRSEADKIIDTYRKYGAPYFELAQLARISPKTYGLIQTSIVNGKLHYDGEILDLQPANAAKVGAAIKDLRRDYKNSPRSTEPHDEIGKLSRRCDALVRDFETHLETRGTPNWHRAAKTLQRVTILLIRATASYGIDLE